MLVYKARLDPYLTRATCKQLRLHLHSHYNLPCTHPRHYKTLRNYTSYFKMPQQYNVRDETPVEGS